MNHTKPLTRAQANILATLQQKYGSTAFPSTISKNYDWRSFRGLLLRGRIHMVISDGDHSMRYRVAEK